VNAGRQATDAAVDSTAEIDSPFVGQPPYGAPPPCPDGGYDCYVQTPPEDAGPTYCGALVGPVGGCTGPNIVQCGPLLPFCEQIPGPTNWACCSADPWVNGEPCEIISIMGPQFQGCDCFGCLDGGPPDGGADAEGDR
jgi:hypothetical protein